MAKAGRQGCWAYDKDDKQQEEEPSRYLSEEPMSSSSSLPHCLTSEMETPLRYQVTVGFREALLRQCRYPGLLSSSWLSLGISTHLGIAGHGGKGLHRATHQPFGQHQRRPDRKHAASHGALQPSYKRCVSLHQ